MIIFFTKEELKKIYDTLHKYYESTDPNLEEKTFRQAKFQRVIHHFLDIDCDKNLDLSKTDLGTLVDALSIIDPPDNNLRQKIFEAYKAAKAI